MLGDHNKMHPCPPVVWKPLFINTEKGGTNFGDIQNKGNLMQYTLHIKFWGNTIGFK